MKTLKMINDPVDQQPEEYAYNLQRATEYINRRAARQAEREEAGCTDNHVDSPEEKEEWIFHHANRPGMLDAIERWEDITNLTWEEIMNLTTSELIDAVNIKMTSPKTQVRPELVRTSRVEHFLMSTDKITRAIFDNDIEDGDENVRVDTGKIKGKNTAYVNLFFDDLENVKLSKSLTIYEKSVHNAVASLFEKNSWITPYMVYQLMIAGQYKKSDANPDIKTIDEITEIMIKLSRVYVTIRIDEDTKTTKEGFDEDSKDNDKSTYRGPLLALESVSRTLNGDTKTGFHIFREPILMTYAKNKKQIIKVDLKYLENSMRMTKDGVALRLYLLYRIELMSNPKNKIKERSILYETIFKQLEFTQKTLAGINNRKSKLRNVIIVSHLNDLVNMGYIKGFSSEKDKVIIKL